MNKGHAQKRAWPLVGGIRANRGRPAATRLCGGLLLIGWDEDFGDEVFIGRRSGVAG